MARRAEEREGEKQARRPARNGRRSASGGVTEKASKSRPAARRTSEAEEASPARGTSGTDAATATADRKGDEKEAVAEEATGAILGANPFAGVDSGGILEATGRWLANLSRQPGKAASRAATSTVELGKIAVGRSQVAPQKGDRRFADPAWTEHPGFRRTMQSYLLLSSTLEKMVEDAGLDVKNERRALYALELLTGSVAPTNNFWSNH